MSPPIIGLEQRDLSIASFFDDPLYLREDDVSQRSYQQPQPSAEAVKPSTDRKSGRVAFDADGRGVWEWQVDTGVFTRTVTEVQLMDLAATNLQIMESPPSHAERGVWLCGSDSVGTRKAVQQKPSVVDGPVRRLLKRLTRAG